MDYNTGRSKLLMREYGRNVQTLVEKALQEEDAEKRTALAHGIVKLMERLRPSIRQEEDFKHKLWDHLHLIADYELEDVESPFPTPDREVKEKRPERVAYPQVKIKRRHYGKNVEQLIEKCINTEDPEKKEEFKMLIAGFMKMVYKNWHKDNVADEQIAEDLSALSDGELTLEEGTSITALDHGTPGSNNRRRATNRGGGGRNNRKNNNNNRGRNNSRGRNNRGRRR